jgi:DNA-binding winged helix-turn-helix (wHTH) protein
VTLPPALGDRATAPAALWALIEHIADVCGLPVVVQLVTAEPADIDRPTDPDAVRLDGRARTVHRHGAEVALCRREFDLLRYLTGHPGQVFTRGQLLGAVWGDAFTGPRTVDVHIRRLRQKLGTHRPLITTVRGVGYRLATGAPIALANGPVTASPDTRPTTLNLPAVRPAAHRGAA